MLFDTTFLIDLEREIKHGRPGLAQSFLANNPSVPLHISVISAGEFAEGFTSGQEPNCWLSLRRFTVLGLDRAIAWRAGQLSRQLRAAGRNIGDNDIWIGATALDHQFSLVTANAQHFERIEGLQIVTY